MKQIKVKSDKSAETIPSENSEPVKELISKLNKQFESRVRLGIMSVLMVNESVDFVTLKDLLDITDGNLASHLSALEKNRLIEVKKQFIGRKPNTKYTATSIGKIAFREHLDYLGMLVKSNNEK
jgi:DNA-binding HxlR family transcriptional regulator